MRAWIEMVVKHFDNSLSVVALFTRAWIEIDSEPMHMMSWYSRPLHEGVDCNKR